MRGGALFSGPSGLALSADGALLIVADESNSALRAVSPAVAELPAMVQAKYRACQAMCFCGVFPEIRRAWASIDNSLFLWRYDRL